MEIDMGVNPYLPLRAEVSAEDGSGWRARTNMVAASTTATTLAAYLRSRPVVADTC
jgi:hypothetical protein